MLQTKSETARGSIAWIAAGVILIALAAGLWLFSVRKPSTQKNPDQTLSKTVIRKKMPQNPMLAKRIVTKKMIPVKTTDDPVPDPKSQQAPAAEPSVEPQAQIKIDPAAKEKAVSSESPTESMAQINIDQTEKVKEVVSESPTESMAPINIDQTEKVKEVAAGSLTESQAPNGIIQVKKEKKVPPEPMKTALPKKDSQPRILPQPEVQPESIGFKSAVPEIQREEWLLSQEGTAYTIQIIGVSSEDSLFDFVKRNGMLKQNKMAYYESTFRGKPWFQLLYGIYPDKRTARLAANKLPENIRQAGPWIRKISTVQKTIENR